MAKQRLSGKVIKNNMDRTVVVEVERKIAHPLYKKVIVRRKKYFAHTDDKLDVGTVVTIELTRPISKLKRWKVVNKNNKKSK